MMARLFIFLTMISALEPCSPAQPVVEKLRVVVSGFQPFQGRKQNASYVLATAIKKAGGDSVELIEIPVVWGQPGSVIDELTRAGAVDLWIAFGEGKDSALWIETTAHNNRLNAKDGSGATPGSACIQPVGPARLTLEDADIQSITGCLLEQGLMARLSTSAGRYLCEEMLYELLSRAQSKTPAINSAVFFHVPVLGGKCACLNGKAQAFTTELCDQLAPKLLAACTKFAKIKSP